MSEQYEAGDKTTSAEGWIASLQEADKVFKDYQDVAKDIDERYASLKHLSTATRDREFQMFWANIEVILPSIYARPPVPVVAPKFRDRRPLYQVSSEFLERCTIVSFDMADVDSVMREVRDDLAIVGRGVAWIRFEDDAETGQRVCVEHVDRKDFLHQPARKWADVDWVAKRSWLTEAQMTERFGVEAAKNVTYCVQDKKQDDGQDSVEKAGIWEIWCKSQKKVYWVCEDYPEFLDSGKPHLDLETFWPTPKPTYATVQRRTLIPVPDMLFYRDQLDELDAITSRIHALSDSIKVMGFYPAGSEIGDAIEAGLSATEGEDRRNMIPVANWPGSTNGLGIEWFPIEIVASTVSQLVLLRRQIIEDIYQVSGISDIQRGETDPNETLGAQELKQSNGAVRIRSKQQELVRYARDIGRIVAEILPEEFDQDTLVEMAQMELPTDADIKKQLSELKQQTTQLTKQAQQAAQDPRFQQLKEQNPEQAQDIVQQIQAQINGLAEEGEKLSKTPTIDQVMKFLKSNKLRAFVLDIETDSTIQPNEQAEKQARTEFMGAFTQASAALAPLAQLGAAGAALSGGLLKFALAPFRAGRELDGQIDEFVDQMGQQAGQDKPNPEAEALAAKTQIEQQKLQLQSQQMEAANQKAMADVQMKQAELQLKSQDAQMRMAESQAAFQAEQMRLQTEMEAQRSDLAQKQADVEKTYAEIQKIMAEIQKMGVDTALSVRAADNAEQNAEIDNAMKIESAEVNRFQAENAANQEGE